MSCYEWVGILVDFQFSPCQVCGRALSQHGGNQALTTTTPPHPVKGEGASVSQGSDDE